MVCKGVYWAPQYEQPCYATLCLIIIIIYSSHSNPENALHGSQMRGSEGKPGSTMFTGVESISLASVVRWVWPSDWIDRGNIIALCSSLGSAKSQGVRQTESQSLLPLELERKRSYDQPIIDKMMMNSRLERSRHILHTPQKQLNPVEVRRRVQCGPWIGY
jgi:hypothetical protein